MFILVYLLIAEIYLVISCQTFATDTDYRLSDKNWDIKTHVILMLIATALYWPIFVAFELLWPVTAGKV